MIATTDIIRAVTNLKVYAIEEHLSDYRYRPFTDDERTRFTSRVNAFVTRWIDDGEMDFSDWPADTLEVLSGNLAADFKLSTADINRMLQSVGYPGLIMDW